MASYIVDDGGDNSDGTTWAKAFTSLDSLRVAVGFVAGDTVYIGHDHIDQFTYTGTKNYTFPTNYDIVSVQQGVGTIGGGDIVYLQSTSGRQLDSAKDGAYAIGLLNGATLKGISVKAGGAITIYCQYDQLRPMMLNQCLLFPGHNSRISLSGDGGGVIMKNTTINLTGDTGAASTEVFQVNIAHSELYGVTVLNGSNRTGRIFTSAGLSVNTCRVMGLDVSSCTGASALAHDTSIMILNLSHVKTPASFALVASTPLSRPGSMYTFTNVGNGNQPAGHALLRSQGSLQSTVAVYRTGGAEFENLPVSWGGLATGLTVSSASNPRNPYQTPWMALYFTSTGSKTVTIPIVNDTALFTNLEVWADVMYQAGASSGLWTFATTQPAIPTAASNHPTESSTWNGSGPSFTYKQTISITFTVGTIGQALIRLGFGLTSMVGTRYCYIDPKPIVT